MLSEVHSRCSEECLNGNGDHSRDYCESCVHRGRGFLHSLNMCEFPCPHFVYFPISVFASSEDRAKKELNLVQREVFLAGVRV